MGQLGKNQSEMVESQMKQMQAYDAPRLREELAKAFRVTVEQIVRMAAIIRLLEDRGENLDDIKSSMLGNLRRVAYGQILPDVMVRFQSVPLLLNRVSMLPIPDQQRLLSDEPIKVMILENGKTDHRLVRPLKMSKSEIQQVFAGEHLRDDGEQVSWLRNGNDLLDSPSSRTG